MGVDLGGLDVCMTKKLLQYPNVDPVFQHVGGKAVPQGLAANLFVDPGLGRRPFYRFLQPGFEGEHPTVMHIT
jgi:hypothetical protein